MITAEEAKELCNDSTAVVEYFLKTKIEPQIIAAARSGKCTVNVLLGATPVYQNVWSEVLDSHRGALEKLKELGYKASIGTYGNRYLSKGLGIIDDKEIEHVNFGFIISW